MPANYLEQRLMQVELELDREKLNNREKSILWDAITSYARQFRADCTIHRADDTTLAKCEEVEKLRDNLNQNWFDGQASI